MAVWSEASKTGEGVLSSVWVQGRAVHYPIKNAAKLALVHAVPAQNWKKYLLQKIKFCASMQVCVRSSSNF